MYPRQKRPPFQPVKDTSIDNMTRVYQEALADIDTVLDAMGAIMAKESPRRATKALLELRRRLSILWREYLAARERAR